ncbi:hypothetical protein [Sphingobium sp.]|uniref:hypothetical protein n=1 Tax=Sphingobium sp. TaxID=1912891 RepID=UPI0028BF1870|nr:hypothetical protein [Sphingobium sp.]
MGLRAARAVWRAGLLTGLAAGGFLAASPGIGQVGQATDEDFQEAPPQFREALSGGRIKPDESELTRQNVQGVPPSADPRDFNGMYNFLRKPRAGGPGGGPGGAPGGAGGPPPMPRPAAAGGAPAGGGRQPNIGSRACQFAFPGLTSYSTTIVMNDRSVIFLMEENHALRWARFTDRHQANFTPTYSGDSIAKWEGNTLVVDTEGVKVEGQAATDHYVEKFAKLPDGNIAIDRFRVDASGALTPAEQVTLRWRPDLHYVEDICEDLGEAFGVNYQ